MTSEEPAVTRSTSTDPSAGPRVLSLHPTSICARECAPCYLKRSATLHEKPVDFFVDVIREAAQARTIREVMLSVNIDPDGSSKNREMLKSLSAAAREAGLRLVVTTNYENIKSWGAEAFADCHRVTISLDEYKFPGLKIPGDFFTQITQLQAEGCVVNLNVLLSRQMLEYLTLPRLRRWLGVADQVFLIIAKHFPLDFTREELLAFFGRIAPVWEEPDRFFHLQVDNCIKPEVFPWNQLVPHCDWGSGLVNILPDGGMGLCSMDQPVLQLERAQDLGPMIQQHYVDQQHEPRAGCPFIDFALGD